LAANVKSFTAEAQRTQSTAAENNKFENGVLCVNFAPPRLCGEAFEFDFFVFHKERK